MKVEEVLERVRKKGEICLGEILHETDEPHSLDDDWFLEFPLANGKRAILVGLSENQRDLLLEIHKRIGIRVYWCDETREIFMTLSKDGEERVNELAEVSPLELLSIKLRFCVGCRFKADCPKAVSLKTPLPGG